MAPKLAAFGDEITQNEKLFARIAAVYEAREKARAHARAAAPRLARLHELRARRRAARRARPRSGWRRSTSAWPRSSRASARTCSPTRTSYVLVLENEADLAGLPDSVRAGAAAAAEARGHEGQVGDHQHALRDGAVPHLLRPRATCARRSGARTYSRGDNGDAHDNNAIIAEILKLRAERAKLLGYATHAHWRLENAMAKTPERAMELMEAVWKPAVARVREEVADMQAIADKEGAKHQDRAVGLPLLRREGAQGEVRPRPERGQALPAAREAARGDVLGRGRALRLRVHAGRRACRSCHPDVRVWEVKDADAASTSASGTSTPTRAPGKRSGAWMNAYRSQERFDGEVTTIVSNNSNFVKGKPGEPVLVSWDDATTLFHEFGHALHGLRSNVTYPSLAGHRGGARLRRVPVAAPRALAARRPRCSNRFALHYQTGKPIPPELVEKIERATTFNQGFATVEYLARRSGRHEAAPRGRRRRSTPTRSSARRWPRSACRRRS